MVQNLFETSKSPLSVADLLEVLQRQGQAPNKTTLYRMLDRFCAAGVLRAVQVPGGAALYEKHTTPHGHLLCTQCDTVECLSDIPMHSFLPNVQQKMPNKQIESMHLSFSGTCKKCTSSNTF